MPAKIRTGVHHHGTGAEGCAKRAFPSQVRSRRNKSSPVPRDEAQRPAALPHPRGAQSSPVCCVPPGPSPAGWVASSNRCRARMSQASPSYQTFPACRAPRQPLPERSCWGRTDHHSPARGLGRREAPWPRVAPPPRSKRSSPLRRRRCGRSPRGPPTCAESHRHPPHQPWRRPEPWEAMAAAGAVDLELDLPPAPRPAGSGRAALPRGLTGVGAAAVAQQRGRRIAGPEHPRQARRPASEASSLKLAAASHPGHHDPGRRNAPRGGDHQPNPRRDYAQARTERRAHDESTPSNYAIEGTSEVLQTLAALGKHQGVATALIWARAACRSSALCLPAEPSPRGHCRRRRPWTFSADKLLGGPQAGLTSKGAIAAVQPIRSIAPFASTRSAWRRFAPRPRLGPAGPPKPSPTLAALAARGRLGA